MVSVEGRVSRASEGGWPLSTASCNDLENRQATQTCLKDSPRCRRGGRAVSCPIIQLLLRVAAEVEAGGGEPCRWSEAGARHYTSLLQGGEI